MDLSFQLILLTESTTEKFEIVLFSCDKIIDFLGFISFFGRRGYFFQKNLVAELDRRKWQNVICNLPGGLHNLRNRVNFGLYFLHVGESRTVEEDMRMASRLTRNQLPGNRLRVRLPCPPLEKVDSGL